MPNKYRSGYDARTEQPNNTDKMEDLFQKKTEEYYSYFDIFKDTLIEMKRLDNVFNGSKCTKEDLNDYIRDMETLMKNFSTTMLSFDVVMQHDEVIREDFSAIYHFGIQRLETLNTLRRANS